jgi:hypothetical protein
MQKNRPFLRQVMRALAKYGSKIYSTTANNAEEKGCRGQVFLWSSGVPGTVYLSRRDALIKLLNEVKVLNYGKDGQSCRASLSAPCQPVITGNRAIS